MHVPAPTGRLCRFSTFLCLSLAVMAGCRSSASELEHGLTVAPTLIPAGNASAEPNIASTADGRAVASWIERLPAEAPASHALRVSFYDPANDAWTEPSTVAEGSNWFVNWADFPSVVADEAGRLYAHWLVKSGPATYAYDVFLSTSEDGGGTWSQPRKLHDDDTQTEHGFVSMVPVKGGGVLAVWLDGRSFETGSHLMSLRSRIAPAAGDFGEEMLIDELVCDCCQTATVSLAGGDFLTVYRNRTEDEIRDIYAAVFDGSEWSRPFAVHDDGWEISGCPVNGPAAASNGRHAAAAWFTGAAEAPGVYTAYYDAETGRFGEPMQVDEGNPEGRVDIALLDDGSSIVVWLERGDGSPAQIMARRIKPDGTRSRAMQITETTAARAGGFPRMAFAGTDLVIVWTDSAGEEPRVRAKLISMDSLD